MQVLRGVAQQDWSKVQQVAVEVHTPELLQSIQTLLQEHFQCISINEDKALSGTGLTMLYATKPH